MSKNAEEDYRLAWRRILDGKSTRVPLGSQSTLANIAREAGKDPSALKKSRYPTFIHEVETHNKLMHTLLSGPDRSLSAQLEGARAENRTLRSERDDLRQERDTVKSQVINLQQALLEMGQRLDKYVEPINVAVLDLHKRQIDSGSGRGLPRKR